MTGSEIPRFGAPDFGRKNPGEHGAPMPPPPTPEQVAFMNRLGVVNARNVRPLPDLASRVNHEGIIADEQHTADRLSVNFAPDVLGHFPDGERPGQITFEPKPLAQFGKEKSYRKASFGRMTFTSESGTTHEEEVVIKQFPIGGKDDALPNAVQEVTMLAYVKELGLPTIDVIGTVVDRYARDPAMYVITRMKDGLESMDELSWRNLRVADLGERLEPLVETLEALHGDLVFSGDPKFKNIGVGEDGKPIIFDLEPATSCRDLVANMTPENEEQVMARLTKRMANDFSHVAVSLDQHVHPNLPQRERPQTPTDRFQFEYEHVLEPYHMRLMAGNSPHKAVLNRAYNRVLEERRNRAQREQAALER